MIAPRIPMTFCSFAGDVDSDARALILDGAFDPPAAFHRAKELGLLPIMQTGAYQMIAFVVPPAPEVSEQEYQAYAANRHRLLTLGEAKELLGQNRSGNSKRGIRRNEAH